MYKKFICFLCCFIPSISYGDDLITRAEQVFDAARIVCSGISDEISKVSNISKINTAVTGVGTVAAGGALVAGIKKTQEEEEIDKLVAEICAAGGCTVEGGESMSNEDFFNNVIQPMAEIAELQERLEKSKKLGNWRTGLMAGTIGTNVASAIISGVNRDQSELIQHIQACNTAIQSANDMSRQLKAESINPMENPIVKKLNNVNTWCSNIDAKDVEKIEKRMTGVMGTSIAGAVIGVAGTATSASANSDKYMDKENRIGLSEQDRKKKDNLNTTANVMAGANVATGLVETGLNISLITLTKKLIKQAEKCEEVFE
jgi:hypothetical protein